MEKIDSIQFDGLDGHYYLIELRHDESEDEREYGYYDCVVWENGERWKGTLYHTGPLDALREALTLIENRKDAE